MEDLQVLFKYIWMVLVAAIGGTLGFISKVSPTLRNKALKVRIKAYLMGLVTSMFVAYVVFEVSFYLVANERMAVALAGLASFAGTDLLVIMEEKLIDVIRRKADRA